MEYVNQPHDASLKESVLISKPIGKNFNFNRLILNHLQHYSSYSLSELKCCDFYSFIQSRKCFKYSILFCIFRCVKNIIDLNNELKFRKKDHRHLSLWETISFLKMWCRLNLANICATQARLRRCDRDKCRISKSTSWGKVEKPATSISSTSPD